jgi:hypothetical protein
MYAACPAYLIAFNLIILIIFFEEQKLSGSSAVTEDDMSKVCSKHGREEECIQDFRGNTGRKQAIRMT